MQFQLRKLTFVQDKFNAFNPFSANVALGFLMFSEGVEVTHWLKMG